MDNKDFDILAGILLNDKAYLGAGGANVIDDKGGFDAVTNMAYSVYLYLKKLDTNMCTIQEYRNII